MFRADSSPKVLIASARQRFLRGAGDDTPEVRSVAERGNVLPLFRAWDGLIGLRDSGELVVLPYDGGPERVEEDPVWILAALVRGAQKYPELASLLPIRSPAAKDCGQCRGAGGISVPGPYRVPCGQCGGLGWIDPEAAKEAVAQLAAAAASPDED